MTYSIQTWSDNNAAYPASAARFAHIETGVYDAHVRPAARAYRSSTQAIASGAYDALSFDVERYDNDGIWSAGFPTRFTIQESGIYLVTGLVVWTTAAAGVRGIRARVNGATVIQTDVRAAMSGDAVPLFISTVWQFAAADYVEIQVLQSTGGALNTLASTAANAQTEGGVALLSYL